MTALSNPSPIRVKQVYQVYEKRSHAFQAIPQDIWTLPCGNGSWVQLVTYKCADCSWCAWTETLRYYRDQRKGKQNEQQ